MYWRDVGVVCVIIGLYISIGCAIAHKLS